MKNTDVEIIDNDLYIGTWKISKLFEVEHRSLRNIIKKNLTDITEVGENEPKERSIYYVSDVINKTDKKRKRGRPVVEFLLNEPQATFVILLLKGQYKKDHVSLVVKFKKHITTAFYKQRKLISRLLVQKQNAEWLEKRKAGKIERRLETDTIKQFIEYANTQGSKNAKKYYMAISKMENKSLFYFDFLSLKFPNIRDIAEGFQLTSLQMADRIVSKALKDGMKEKLPYKEIYTKAKKNVELFAEVLGKTPLQLEIQKFKALTNK